MSESDNEERTLVMGIVNVTPDSFSDGGAFLDPSAAIAHAYRLIEEGADVLDIGGESTRPGHESVSWEEEWRRLEPVLKELRTHTGVRISVDTTKAHVAYHALSLGVDIINDVWGGLADPEMLPLIAGAKCTYVWMHNRAKPADKNGYEVLVAQTKTGVNRCLEAGIDESRIWIDPGIGFGKTQAQNLNTLRRLSEYCRLGYPVLLGTSRKSVIGHALSLPVDQRLEGSLATVAHAVFSGVRVIRVHDVKESVRICRMLEAIAGAADD